MADAPPTNAASSVEAPATSNMAAAPAPPPPAAKGGVKKFFTTVLGLPETEGSPADELLLARQGYKQETPRQFNIFTTIMVNISNVCVLLNIPLFGYVVATGGFYTLNIVWWIVSFCMLNLALSLSELCSAMPVMGSLYMFSFILGGEKYGPFAAWLCAWMNLIGNLAAVAAGCAGTASFLASVITENNPEFEASSGVLYGFYLIFVAFCTILNIFGKTVLPIVSTWISYLVIIGWLMFIIWLPVSTGGNLFPTSVMFTEFYDGTGWTEAGSAGVVYLIAMLPATWNFIGLDASSHVSEESHGSDRAASYGIIITTVWGLISGYILYFCLYLSIQDIDAIRESDDPILTLLQQCFPDSAAIVSTFLSICLVCFSVSNSTTMLTSSRMFFALARDHALPKSDIWHVIDPKFGTPVRAILICTLIVVVLGLASFSDVAFPALTSISTIGSVISYGIPCMMRLTPHGRETFKPGRFNLGGYSMIAAAVASLFVPFITIVLCLPQAMPVDALNLNYAPVVFGASLIFVIGWWFASASRNWTGIKKLISDEELHELEMKAAGEGALKGSVGTTEVLKV
ncbi:amino acid permease-domain-containing protein [Hyaloraphidium curvatum]|nr:amino acid permease-domain-containing protein [Hyaloraphidium curvatum]